MHELQYQTKPPRRLCNFAQRQRTGNAIAKPGAPEAVLFLLGTLPSLRTGYSLVVIPAQAGIQTFGNDQP